MRAAVSTRTVPFLDLATQHEAIRAELDLAWRTIIGASSFVGGEAVDRFEAEFAAYCGTEHCVGVGNGTDAIQLALMALGIGPGDEVIVPANTFIATAAAVAAAGAVPVFADVDDDTLLITAESVDAVRTSATAAVIAVHLYGQTPDIDSIRRLTTDKALFLIEDAAQAHGATWRGRPAGSLGDVATFSFYPGKNLGAFGDGGAVVTDDDRLAERVRMLANHGRPLDSRYSHHVPGFNSRLDALQASVLSVKLRYLERWNAQRHVAAERYVTLLADTPCRTVFVRPEAVSAHHLQVVRVDDRNQVVAHLDRRGIGWALHYPVPCHKQPAFSGRAGGEPLPVAERAAREILSIPMSPSLGVDDVDYVCECLVQATSKQPDPAP